VATAYLALGSNLGDRLAHLRAATGALARELRIAARSPIFESPAVADHPQPPYLNAALRVETALPPRALLDRCLAIEAALGRVRPAGQRFASRTIDIDVLLYEDAVVDEPDLVLPHPRLLERSFVRLPLALVAAPGLRHPRTGDRLDEPVEDSELRRLDEAL
jgi:2-amino-4-hydroxy-6-hydroxymethyldihydropteridine diphosphokinase